MTDQQRNKDDPIALRKQLIQMRLELNRQKIRHEGLALLEPVHKLRGYQKYLSQGSKPLLLVAGVTLASFLMARNHRAVSSLLPVLRVASSLLPLLTTYSRPTSSTSTAQADNLNQNKTQ
ncbi:MAG TPA: hypothetical protein VFD11_07590 [Thiopseudomonas sp.]|nr:hypothetical protein [Thiopseudomonas sp.]